jgi:glutamate/aspartate transport system substrate-binding protein
VPKRRRRAPAALTGTLARVREAGTIAIGYRDASVPFSYLGPHKLPVGYSVEPCNSPVSAIEDAVNRRLTTRWVPVTPENRIAAVESGRVDLECGSTTSNLERQTGDQRFPRVIVVDDQLQQVSDVGRCSPFFIERHLIAETVPVSTSISRVPVQSVLRSGQRVLPAGNPRESKGRPWRGMCIFRASTLHRQNGN